MAELSNRVYAAACYLEELEHLGLVYGNGHHAAQMLARMAQNELAARWIEGEA